MSGSVAHSATLPQISQSHAPDDGQNIARNMLS